jgi:hypothetical protein
MTPLKKREVWKTVVDSKFAIWLGALISAEAVIFSCRGMLIQGSIDLLRTGIYTKLSVDGIRAGKNVLRNNKTQRQYNEVSDEIQNL